MAKDALERFLPDEEATARLGDDIAAALAPGDVVALQGDLGAGKTALARAVIRALAGDPGLEVPSPTFTLVQSYATRFPVHHIDLYRLGGSEELEELGLDEAAETGVVLVEWPERAPARFGLAIRVGIAERDAGRQVAITGPEPALSRLSRSFAIRSFLESAGRGSARRAYLLGDASIRAYETIEAGNETLILMDAPARHDEPVVRNGLPYSRMARLAQSVEAFAAVAGALRDAGLSAPRIEAHDYRRGLLLIEHLGTGSFLDDHGAPVAERYRAAAELLARIHERDWPRDLPLPGGGVHSLPPYDHAALSIETELLLDWYVPYAAGRAMTETERAEYAGIWRRLFDGLDGAERSIVLRDFHSPNIIWRPERNGIDRLGLIDVQDAVHGPTAYDVASLALDARVTIPPELEAATVEAYCAARGKAGAFDRPGFEEAYAITAAQRNSKLLGTFVRLDRRDGKPAYLRHLPRIRAYLRRALEHPALAELAAFYDRAGLLEDLG